jgi:hypothetical protein
MDPLIIQRGITGSADPDPQRGPNLPVTAEQITAVRQGGFDGDLNSRVLSLGRGRLHVDAPSEEVPVRVA